MKTQAKKFPTPSEVIADQSASYWLRETLRTALDRDPVDALNDAQFLLAILNKRLQDIKAGARITSWCLKHQGLHLDGEC